MSASIPTWYDRPSRLAALQTAAESWTGTPFLARGRTKGVGVCCHQLAAAVYRESGWPGLDAIEVSDGPANWARHSGRSLLEEWFDGDQGLARFADVALEGGGRAWIPGDLLGVRIGRCLHHLAIVLPGEAVVHALDHRGVVLSRGLPDAFLRRVARVWRPKP